MSDKLTKFTYNKQFITFDFGDDSKMINATEMAKPFKKLVGGFLRSQSTKDYIILLEARYADLHNEKKREVLRVVQGGTPELQGTWMDEKLALKFAAWLSPAFELWVYDRIDELLKTGKTEIPNYTPSNIIKGLRLIVEQLEQQELFNQDVKDTLAFHAEKIDDLEAKLTSIDENYYSISGWCALHAIPCPLDKAQRWGKLATARSNSMRMAVGKAYDAKYGDINTYHKNVLMAIIPI